jgi:hypothetical protein
MHTTMQNKRDHQMQKRKRETGQRRKRTRLASYPFISQKTLATGHDRLPDSPPFTNSQSSVSLMDSLIRVVTHVHYNTYSNHPERIEPIFNLFLTTADGDSTMAAVHAETGVPTTTLYSWR